MSNPDARRGTPLGAILAVVVLAPVMAAAEEVKTRAEWSRVQGLEPGTRIVLIVKGGAARSVRIGTADGTSVTVIKPTEPTLPADVEQALFTLGPRLPNVLDGYSARVEDVRVTRDGVFRGQEKLAELAQVVERVSRAEVVEVRGDGPEGRTRHGKLGAIIGGLTSFGLCSVAFATDTEEAFDGGYYAAACGLGAAAGAGIGALVGMGIKGKPIVWYQTSDLPVTDIDAATQARMRQALPLALRGGGVR